jgi:muramoyltetrapeptide carboxypeptidase LdcA involved in peptidoglycan recycling
LTKFGYINIFFISPSRKLKTTPLDNKREHLEDSLHLGFEDKEVSAITTSTGGSTANQVLKYLDFKIIRKSPKILCDYSDIRKTFS